MSFNPEGAGVISINNSSTATLTANSIFTGAADEVVGYANVSVLIFTDQASATNGLSIQWSTDSNNWDDTDTYTIPVSTGKAFTFGVEARYVRIVYTNGPVGQSIFRLQTIFHNVSPKPSSHRISDALTGENDAELVEAVLFAKQGSNWINVVATAAGALTVDASGTTQPISGTITANQGVNAAVGSAWPIKFTDGSNAITAGDNTNNALRVNVVAGGAGGGVAQLQVQDVSGNWKNVGFLSGYNVPVGGPVVGGTTLNTPYPVIIGGQDVVNVTRAMLVDGTGAQYVTMKESVLTDILQELKKVVVGLSVLTNQDFTQSDY